MFSIDNLRNKSEIRRELKKALDKQRRNSIPVLPDRNWVLSLVLPKRKARVLDIGPCAMVFEELLDRDKRALFEYHTMDIRPRETPRPDTIEHVHNANELGYPFQDGYFDLIIASDVIEHVKETDLFLSELKRIMKPDGQLFLTTPNYGSMVALKRVFFGRMFHDPLGGDLEKYCFYEHVRYFTTRDLRRYMTASGLYPHAIIHSGILTDSGYLFKPFFIRLFVKYIYNQFPRLNYRFSHQIIFIAGRNQQPLSTYYLP